MAYNRNTNYNFGFQTRSLHHSVWQHIPLEYRSVLIDAVTTILDSVRDSYKRRGYELDAPLITNLPCTMRGPFFLAELANLMQQMTTENLELFLPMTVEHFTECAFCITERITRHMFCEDSFSSEQLYIRKAYFLYPIFNEITNFLVPQKFKWTSAIDSKYAAVCVKECHVDKFAKPIGRDKI